MEEVEEVMDEVYEVVDIGMEKMVELVTIHFKSQREKMILKEKDEIIMTSPRLNGIDVETMVTTRMNIIQSYQRREQKNSFLLRKRKKRHF